MHQRIQPKMKLPMGVKSAPPARTHSFYNLLRWVAEEDDGANDIGRKRGAAIRGGAGWRWRRWCRWCEKASRRAILLLNRDTMYLGTSLRAVEAMGDAEEPRAQNGVRAQRASRQKHKKGKQWVASVCLMRMSARRGCQIWRTQSERNFIFFPSSCIEWAVVVWFYGLRPIPTDISQTKMPVAAIYETIRDCRCALCSTTLPSANWKALFNMVWLIGKCIMVTVGWCVTRAFSVLRPLGTLSYAWMSCTQQQPSECHTSGNAIPWRESPNEQSTPFPISTEKQSANTTISCFARKLRRCGSVTISIPCANNSVPRKLVSFRHRLTHICIRWFSLQAKTNNIDDNAQPYRNNCATHTRT